MAQLVCIDNEGVEHELLLRKRYTIVADGIAELAGMIRVIDETGEDYLYDARRFMLQPPPKIMDDDIAWAIEKAKELGFEPNKPEELK